MPRRTHRRDPLEELAKAAHEVAQLARATLRNLQLYRYCEARRTLILLRRRFRELHRRGQLCDKCYDMVLKAIERLETEIEEREYGEILREWSIVA